MKIEESNLYISEKKKYTFNWRNYQWWRETDSSGCNEEIIPNAPARGPQCACGREAGREGSTTGRLMGGRREEVGGVNLGRREAEGEGGACSSCSLEGGTLLEVECSLEPGWLALHYISLTDSIERGYQSSIPDPILMAETVLMMTNEE